MKTSTTRRLTTLARALTGIGLLIPLLLSTQSRAQSSTESEELARLRAEKSALEMKLNSALEQLAALQGAKKPAPAAAESAGPVKATTAPMTAAPAPKNIPSAAAVSAPSSSARPATEGNGAVVMEAFAVTGSNIKRFDQEKILPVTIFNSDTIAMRNALTATDLLMALPQVTALAEVESRSASAGARGDHAAISIRNLGSSAALVLVNGRRVAPHPMAGNLAVNVNVLPNQGISQIEVLRDGASAIYGSDAIAGVVNYVMRTDYRGTNLKTRFSSPESIGWNGQSVEATLTMGRDFAGGRGRFLTTVDAFYREAIFLKRPSLTPPITRPWRLRRSIFRAALLTRRRPSASGPHSASGPRP